MIKKRLDFLKNNTTLTKVNIKYLPGHFPNLLCNLYLVQSRGCLLKYSI